MNKLGGETKSQLIKLGKVSRETKGQSGPWLDWVWRRGDIP